jgi:hypothetical protein
MAFTFADFKRSLKGIFGAKRSVLSGDGGGDLDDHIARVFQRTVRGAEFPATATVTQALVVTPKVLFRAEEECKVVRVSASAAGSLTISNTDHVRLTIIKRTAVGSYSLTESVGTLEIGRSAGGTVTWVNKPGFSGNATLATTTSVIDMDPGDVLIGQLSRPGGAVALQSPVAVHVTVEEY